MFYINVFCTFHKLKTGIHRYSTKNTCKRPNAVLNTPQQNIWQIRFSICNGSRFENPAKNGFAKRRTLSVRFLNFKWFYLMGLGEYRTLHGINNHLYQTRKKGTSIITPLNKCIFYSNISSVPSKYLKSFAASHVVLTWWIIHSSDARKLTFLCAVYRLIGVLTSLV